MIFKNIFLALITVLLTFSCSMTVPVYSDQFESFDPSSYDLLDLSSLSPFQKPLIFLKIQ